MRLLLQTEEISKDNMSEMSVEGVDFLFSVGGDDKRTLVWILKNCIV